MEVQDLNSYTAKLHDLHQQERKERSRRRRSALLRMKRVHPQVLQRNIPTIGI